MLKSAKKTQKLEKLKRKLLKTLTRYDLPRVVPCERAHPVKAAELCGTLSFINAENYCRATGQAVVP